MEDSDRFLLTQVKNRLNIFNKLMIKNNHNYKKNIKQIPNTYTYIQEHQNNQDFDNNGMIYGYDFIFEISEDLPVIIKIYQDGNFKDKDVKKIFWNSREIIN